MIQKTTLIMLSLLCVLTTIIASAAIAQTTGKKPVAISANSSTNYDRARTIARIEAYLSGLTTLKSDFSQVAPNGDVSEGIFFLKRPGKMRWQYSPPTPILLVSNGKTFTYYDAEMDQVNYIDVDDTLASFLGRADIRMDSDAIAISQFSAAAGVIRISIIERVKPKDGTLTMEFTEAPLALKNLVISDATGATTRIQLQNATFGLKLPDSLFIFKDPRGVKVRQSR